MKRYEERLIEDMQSLRWQVSLAVPPPIYRLPTEILLNVFEYIMQAEHLKSVRCTSKRFAALATTFLFQCFRLDHVLPSKMYILAYLIDRNPSIGRYCRSLRLILDGNRKTTAKYYTGLDRTTMHQDIAQADVIRASPVLQAVHIHIIQTHTPDRSEIHSDFHQTFAALSSCKTLRRLEISGGFNKDELFNLLSVAQSHIQELRLNDLESIVSIIEQDLDAFPVLSGIKRLSSRTGSFPLPRLANCLERLMPNLERVELIYRPYCPNIASCVLSISGIRQFGSLVIKLDGMGTRWASVLPNGRAQLLLTHSTNLELLSEIVHTIGNVTHPRRGLSHRNYVIHLTKQDPIDNSTSEERTLTLGELEVLEASFDPVTMYQARMARYFQGETCKRSPVTSPWDPDYCHMHASDALNLPRRAIMPF
ncbi:hypothetical protein CPB86DRAFT_871649 [Serendipita vermifera]|nr:hypothetical protein CPB86DRAFT_871649 [Serendipita vermifera]